MKELWPLILRLDGLALQDKSHPHLLLTLATAQATLGIILGDLLPEEALWISVHFFKKAVAIVDEYGNALLKAEIYRKMNNGELLVFWEFGPLHFWMVTLMVLLSQVNPANHPSGYLQRWGAEAGAAKGYAFAEAFHYIGL